MISLTPHDLLVLRKKMGFPTYKDYTGHDTIQFFAQHGIEIRLIPGNYTTKAYRLVFKSPHAESLFKLKYSEHL